MGRLRLLDLRAVASAHPVEESVVADLLDQAAIAEAVTGADGILHLGGLADEADFPTSLSQHVGPSTS